MSNQTGEGTFSLPDQYKVHKVAYSEVVREGWGYMEQPGIAPPYPLLDAGFLDAPVGASLTAEIVHALAHAGVTTSASATAAMGATFGAWDAALWTHSRHVAKYAAALAEQLSLSAVAVNEVRIAGLLHDVGKVFLPPAVLHKPDALTADEYALMRLHPAQGAHMLAAAATPPGIVEAVRDHHERWDGTGYTAGRAGVAISTGGRILAVADALDAILCDRAYSRSKPLAWALTEIERCAGGQFDTTVVAALEQVVVARGVSFFRAPARVIALHESRAWRRRHHAAVVPLPVEG